VPRRIYRVEPPSDATPEQRRAWTDLNTQLTILSDALGNIRIDTNDTIMFVGDGIVWDDLRVPMTATKKGAANDPDFAAFKNGTFAMLFDAAALQELFFQCQLPHSYKEGTDIYPHIHWAPSDATTGSVTWCLEYTWANIGDPFPTASTITMYARSNQKTDAHQMNSWPPISGRGKAISSILSCRVYRYASDSFDTYAADAALLEVDFHYMVDTIGSQEELTK